MTNQNTIEKIGKNERTVLLNMSRKIEIKRNVTGFYRPGSCCWVCFGVVDVNDINNREEVRSQVGQHTFHVFTILLIRYEELINDVNEIF